MIDWQTLLRVCAAVRAARVVAHDLQEHFSLRTIIGIPPFLYDAARRAGPVGAAAPRARGVQTKQTMRPPGAGRAGDGARSRQTENRGWETGTCEQRERSVRKTCARRRRPARMRAPDRGCVDDLL